MKEWNQGGTKLSEGQLFTFRDQQDSCLPSAASIFCMQKDHDYAYSYLATGLSHLKIQEKPAKKWNFTFVNENY